MTAGETWESCLEEIRQLPAVQKYSADVEVSMYDYDVPSYTGNHIQSNVTSRHGLFQKIMRLQKL